MKELIADYTAALQCAMNNTKLLNEPSCWPFAGGFVTAYPDGRVEVE